MFFVASAGRTGTMALTQGLDTFSDHRVAHEPDPLLEEAWSKHRGLPYFTAPLQERTELYARRQAVGERYGESIRTPNLLPELLAAVPRTPLLVIVREPVEWVRSAHRCRVLQKGDEWDRFRLMPEDNREEHPLARRLAGHWRTVNSYLLSFAERYRSATVALHQPMAPVVAAWARALGVTLTRPAELEAFLATRPNRSGPGGDPDGMEQVELLCRELWQEARALARRQSPASAAAAG